MLSFPSGVSPPLHAVPAPGGAHPSSRRQLRALPHAPTLRQAADVLTRGGNAPVAIHPGHDPKLRGAIRQLEAPCTRALRPTRATSASTRHTHQARAGKKCCKEWDAGGRGETDAAEVAFGGGSYKLLTLLRWQLVGFSLASL